MKITKQRLKQIIYEEYQKILKEQQETWDEMEGMVYSEDGNRSYCRSERGGFDLYQVDRFVGNVKTEKEAEDFNKYIINLPNAQPPVDLGKF